MIQQGEDISVEDSPFKRSLTNNPMAKYFRHDDEEQEPTGTASEMPESGPEEVM